MKRLSDFGRPLVRVLLSLTLLAFAATAMASQVVVVVPTPGNAIQSGNDLLAAYNGITGASSNNRFLVQLEPGVYDLGNQNLVMKDWVSLAGAGVDATLVRGNGNLTSTLPTPVDRGLIQGSENNEIRDLTIRAFATQDRPYLVPIYLTSTGSNPANTRIQRVRTMAFGANAYCGGIFGINTSSVIEDVEIRAACPAQATGIVFQGTTGSGPVPLLRRVDVAVTSNGGTSAWGLAILFPATYTRSIRIEDSVVSAGGGSNAYGLFVTANSSEPPLVTDTTLSGRNASSSSIGAYIDALGLNETRFIHSRIHAEAAKGDSIGILTSADVSVENSVVSGGTNTVVSGASTNVGASKLEGGPASGVVTCAGVYDESFAFFPSTCP